MTSSELAIDSFSFHRFFGECSKWETPSETKWQLSDFLDFATSQSIKLVTLQTAYLDPAKILEDAALQNWQRAGGRTLFTWGHPNGCDGGRNLAAFASARTWLDISAELGAPQMRIVLGNHFNYEQPANERFELIRPELERLLEYAIARKVQISIENHADLNVPVLFEFITSFASDHLGLCFDFGNSYRVGDDLTQLVDDLDIAKIFMVQAKAIKRDPNQPTGPTTPVGWWPTVRYGTGDVHPAPLINRLLERGLSAPVAIEMSNLDTGLTEIDIATDAISYLRELTPLR